MSTPKDRQYWSETGHVDSDKVVLSFTVQIEAFTGSKLPSQEWFETLIGMELNDRVDEANDDWPLDHISVMVGREDAANG